MFLIAFLGGLLTVLSPCILPVVPFLFAGIDRTRSSILLTLGGMVLTFALISSLAVVSSEWVIQANNAGRHVALVVMALFALSLISARISGWLASPFVLLGNRLDPQTRKMSGPLGSLMIGVATGDRVEVSFAGASLTGAALVQRRLRRGVVRLATAFFRREWVAAMGSLPTSGTANGGKAAPDVPAPRLLS